MLLFDPMYKKEKLWKKMKREYKIAYPKVVLVLTGENKDLDRACLLHLPEFIDRKYAGSAIVFYSKESYVGPELPEISGYDVSFIVMEDRVMAEIYELYCFWKYYDNIVFTYTSRPKDNLLQRYLNETDVDVNDAACLALYHLRHVTRPYNRQECADVRSGT